MTKCMERVECVEGRTLTKLVIPSRRSMARDLAIAILGSAASKAQIASERSLSVLRRIGMTTKEGGYVRISRSLLGIESAWQALDTFIRGLSYRHSAHVN